MDTGTLGVALDAEPLKNIGTLDSGSGSQTCGALKITHDQTTLQNGGIQFLKAGPEH